jgi:membrane protein YqaA with SNARE-associated domain
MAYLADIGLAGLFLSAFLAATILPFSSEVVLGLLLANGFEPISTVSVATAGNLLGAVVNYYIGVYGSCFIFQKWLGMSDDQLKKAQSRYQRYGVLSLLFAWVPVVGDPLTVAAGMLKVPLLWFVCLVGLGKGMRYIVIALIMLA